MTLKAYPLLFSNNVQTESGNMTHIRSTSCWNSVGFHEPRSPRSRVHMPHAPYISHVGGPRYIILSASRLRRQAAPRWCSLISPFRSCPHPPRATRLHHLLNMRRSPDTIHREGAEIVKHFAFRRIQCPILLFINLGVSDAAFDTNVKPIPPIPPYILFLSIL